MTGIFRPFLVLLAAILFSLAFAHSGWTAADPELVQLKNDYSQAKTFYRKLMNEKEFGLVRGNWENGVGMFRKIYLARPKHELACSSLFMMGRIYHMMFGRFHNPLDLGESITYYQDVALLFPDSRLADDALYILAHIYQDDKKDRIRAMAAFADIGRRYPDGDMAWKAARELVRLQGGGAPEKSGSAPSTGGNGRLATVLPVKFWSTNDYTRVVVQTSAPVDFRRQLLEKSGNRPRRLYIDFKKSQIDPAAWKPIPIQDGLLRQVRAGQFKPDIVRVVLDIESISQYKIFTLQDPFRTVIDVKGVQERQAIRVLTVGQAKKKVVAPPAPVQGPPVVASAGASTSVVRESTPEPPTLWPGKTKKLHPLPVSAAVRQGSEPGGISLAQQLGLGIKRIVIDPGHGGKDPGAMAKNGLKEKDVVLIVAKKLAGELQKSLGCEVLLTRDHDVFIPLEERTAIANMKKADLFISLHVNSVPSPKVRGVETYLLDLTTDEDAMRLAAFENATSTSNMSDLQNILADLLNNNRKDESTRLAQYVQTNMVRGLKLRNLGVKKAPFYVLIGAQMPAVLSEITFLSNPKEAERLKRDDYLTDIAQQISTGISHYVSESSLARL